MSSVSNNVLLYNGPFTDPTCVEYTTKALAKYSHTIIPCDASYFAREQKPLAYVIPGGAAESMAMSGLNQAAQKVRECVNAGSGYLGICAGALVASTVAEFSIFTAEHPYHYHDPLELTQSRMNLGMKSVTPAFVDGRCRSFFEDFKMPVARLAKISYQNQQFNVFWKHGPIMCLANPSDTPVAFYSKDEVNKSYLSYCTKSTDPVAILHTSFGEGKIACLGIHPELAEYSLTQGFKLSEPDLKWNNHILEESMAYIGLKKRNEEL